MRNRYRELKGRSAKAIFSTIDVGDDIDGKDGFFLEIPKQCLYAFVLDGVDFNEWVKGKWDECSWESIGVVGYGLDINLVHKIYIMQLIRKLQNGNHKLVFNLYRRK